MKSKEGKLSFYFGIGSKGPCLTEGACVALKLENHSKFLYKECKLGDTFSFKVFVS